MLGSTAKIECSSLSGSGTTDPEISGSSLPKPFSLGTMASPCPLSSDSPTTSPSESVTSGSNAESNPLLDFSESTPKTPLSPSQRNRRSHESRSRKEAFLYRMTPGQMERFLSLVWLFKQRKDGAKWNRQRVMETALNRLIADVEKGLPEKTLPDLSDEELASI